MSEFPALRNLAWTEVDLVLRNRRLLSGVIEAPWKTIHTIMRGAVERVYPQTPPCPLSIEVVDGHARTLREGDAVACRLRAFGPGREAISSLVEALGDTQGGDSLDPKGNYSVERVEVPADVDAASVIEAGKEARRSAGLDFSELALRILFPFRFDSPRNRPITWIDEGRFIKELGKGLAWAWEIPTPSRETLGQWKILPYYWHREIPALRKSKTSGDEERSGCLGWLLFKGDTERLFELLVLARATGLGAPLYRAQQIAYPAGRPELPSFGYSAVWKALCRAGTLTGAAKEVLESRDSGGLELADSGGFDRDASDLAREILLSIQDGGYKPEPYRAFAIPKRNGGSRVIEKTSLKDQVLQKGLLDLLYPIIDRSLERSSLGFRKGRRREELIQIVQEAKKAGFRFVAESDVEDFFPSVNRSKLEASLRALLPAADAPAIDLVLASLAAPRSFGGRIEARPLGIPQGSPLAPLCANLFLDAFDEAFLGDEYRLIRFADDFIILARTEEAATLALRRAAEVLGAWDLGLKEEKTCVVPIDGSFEYLGIRFEGGEAKAGLPDLEARPFAKPLFVTTPFSYITVDLDCVEIRRNKEVQASVPIRRVSEVVLLGPASLSTALVAACARAAIPLTMALESGYHLATIKPDSRRHYGISARHREKFEALGDEGRMAVAKDIVAAKLASAKAFLVSRDIAASDRVFIERAIQSVLGGGSVDEIRGHEGRAARSLFTIYRERLIGPEEFRFARRDRDSRDPMNALFNYGYYLLFSRVNALVRTAGLDPYLGFLHEAEDRYESLVADIEELFRARVDRFLIAAVNNRLVQAEHFELTPRGLYLKMDHRKRFLAAYEAELDGSIASDGEPHGPGGRRAKERMTMRELIAVQVGVVRRWAENEGSLEFFKE